MLGASAASADDRRPVLVRHASPGKRASGIVLTTVGSLFFSAGGALAIATTVGLANAHAGTGVGGFVAYERRKNRPPTRTMPGIAIPRPAIMAAPPIA